MEGDMQIVEDYMQATRNALKAGFDGVEIHAGNVSLLLSILLIFGLQSDLLALLNSKQNISAHPVIKPQHLYCTQRQH